MSLQVTALQALVWIATMMVVRQGLGLRPVSQKTCQLLQAVV